MSEQRTFRKYLYIILGSISLGLGILGIFLPLLPTTPFLLLTAALYFKGSKRFYNWLISHKYLGSYIENFRKYKAISKQVKISSIFLLWVTILSSAFFAVDKLWLRLLLIGIAIGVTIHILSYKTLDRNVGEIDTSEEDECNSKS